MWRGWSLVNGRWSLVTGHCVKNCVLIEADAEAPLVLAGDVARHAGGDLLRREHFAVVARYIAAATTPAAAAALLRATRRFWFRREAAGGRLSRVDLRLLLCGRHAL